MTKYIKISTILILVVAVIAGCSSDSNPSKSGTFYGPAVSMGNGTVKSWVKLDDNGKATDLGLEFSDSALNGLPDEETEFALTLPAEASMTAYKMIGVNWNPHGHEPAGVYDKPHFDFHFYLLSMAERAAITGVGDSAKMYKQPADGYSPANYMIGPGTGVPMMGVHAVDVTSPEFNGGTFSETFIYGFYDGNMIFMEPMITVEYLKTNPNMIKDLKLPAKYPVSAYFPMKYSIVHDTPASKYQVSLNSMMARTAN